MDDANADPREGAGGDRGDAFRPRHRAATASARMVADAPRLVHQPPARLGRADRRSSSSKQSGEPLRDPAVMDAHRRGLPRRRAPMPGTSPAPPRASSAPTADPDDYEQVMDIVDVWFECGCTHAFMLTPERGLPWPADLYLEGSDQHRGWFQSSLLESGRHARRRALQGDPDAWLRARRAGPEDVEVARQRHRAAGRDEASTAPTSCGSG